MSIDLTERQIMILLGVRDRKTYQEMADANGVSLKTIQDDLDELRDHGLVENVTNEAGNTKVRGRQLTDNGKGWLSRHGYTVERSTTHAK